MIRHPMRSCVGLAAAAAVLFLAACGDDGTSPPPGIPDDTTAPQPISSLTAHYDAGRDAIIVQWIAPRDDSAHERVDHYEVRRSSTFPFDWENATVVDNPPAPLDPGEMQELVLANPPRSSDVYASVRAVDAAGNMSRVGALAHVGVPGLSVDVVCTDVLSGAPIAGLDAVIENGGGEQITITDAAGRVHETDVDTGTLTIRLASGTGSYHRFATSFSLDADTLLEVPMIPVQQPQSTLYPNILTLLRSANIAVGGRHIIKRWHTYPVQFYARDFVSVFGIDYRTLLQQAAERWNTRLGFQMFAATDADPATGILVEFLARDGMGGVTGVTEYTVDALGFPVHDRIRVVDELDGPHLYSVFMHELGHTIPLGHLPAGFIMFASQPLPPDISDDEVTMVKLLLALPNGTDLDNYDPSTP